MATSPRIHHILRFPVISSAVAVVAAVCVPLGIQQATASPSLSLSQVQAKIAALNNQVEQITESYDGARVRLTTLRRKERLTTAELGRDQSTLSKAQAVIARTAAAEYRSGGQLSSAMSLVAAADPRSFLDKQSGLDQVARYQATQEANANAAQRQVAQVRAVRSAQVAAANKTLAALAAKKTQVQRLLGQQQSLLAHLKAQQRARLAAAQAAQRRREVQLRASAPAPPPSSSSAPTHHVAASGRAGAAVAYAYAQLGKPYQWGGAGPSSFDCSGLTMRAWEAAGVSLPHNAAMQESDIPAVSLSDLQPGDLIFFGSPAYHVAIYIGGGNMIQAPHTGADVEVTPVSYMSPSGAGRP